MWIDMSKVTFVPADQEGEYTVALSDMTNAEEVSAQTDLTGEEFFTELREGDFVEFGSYKQNPYTTETPIRESYFISQEPIQWLVLKVEGSSALLLSRYILDLHNYDDTASASMTWKQSGVRSWLNASFLRSAFTDAEQEAILFTTVSNGSSQNGYDKDSDTQKDGGDDTTDQIFLLSYAEVFGGIYPVVTDYIVAEPTQYYSWKYHSSGRSGGDAYTWYLRGPALYRKTTATSASNELQDDQAVLVNKTGEAVYDRIRYQWGIRPAMWIDLSQVDLSRLDPVKIDSE